MSDPACLPMLHNKVVITEIPFVYSFHSHPVLRSWHKHSKLAERRATSPLDSFRELQNHLFRALKPVAGSEILHYVAVRTREVHS